jgi:hypothetical protein
VDPNTVAVYVTTKDRPGYLRAKWKTGRTPGETYIGTLVVDDSGPDFTVKLYESRGDSTDGADMPAVDVAAALRDAIYAVVHAEPEHTAGSQPELLRCCVPPGHTFTESNADDAIDDLVVRGASSRCQGRSVRRVIGLFRVRRAQNNY